MERRSKREEASEITDEKEEICEIVNEKKMIRLWKMNDVLIFG